MPMGAEFKHLKSHPAGGTILITVCAFIFVALIASAVLMRKISSLSSEFNYEITLNSANDPRNVALADALTVLQTGAPSYSPASYGVTVVQKSITTAYQVTYQSLGNMQWDITISPLETENLPPLPENF